MGHEIVLILAGFTWGLGVGFAIAAVGTLLGELATFLCVLSHDRLRKRLIVSQLVQALLYSSRAKARGDQYQIRLLGTRRS
jgi:uncharacterized membrane protein YdjX (TVP38/TMEM64 family)